MNFRGFPKMARYSRDIIITEKLDGTNAQVCIKPIALRNIDYSVLESSVTASNDKFIMLVGSRTRWITPHDDNHGFAAWCYANAHELFDLGSGQHFGEWWGQSIQRNYGLKEKRFSMFNVGRWALHGVAPKQIPTTDPRVFKTQDILPACCGLVPILYEGPHEEQAIAKTLRKLEIDGSIAAPGFMQPEGIVIFHTAANIGFKKTLGSDGHKGT